MTKKILIPTDFTVKSLRTVLEALERTSPHKVELLLVHTISLPTSITDLLFFSKEKFLRSLQIEDFKSSTDILLNKFDSRIESFNIDLFIGNTTNYLNNFILANHVTDVFLPTNYKMELKHKRSEDLVSLFKKSPVNVTEVPFNEQEEQGKDSISSIFFLKAGA